jgi:RimJ/RimL family protein N-acetyltransferase
MLIHLRPLDPTDLPIFFDHQRDPLASRMAGFASRDPDDREAFMAHWARLAAGAATGRRADSTPPRSPFESIVHRTILADDAVAGYVSKFEHDGASEVCYFLGRDYWNKGIASRALAMFLAEVTTRPLHAGIAFDNIGSRRVLEKCGFRETGRVRGFARMRGEEIEEIRFELR